MATTRRRQILEAMRDRIQAAIPLAAVFVGRTPQLGDDDGAMAVAILPDSDIVDETLPRARRLWEIKILAVRNTAGDDAWLDSESDLFEPIFEAIEDDRAAPSRVRVNGRLVSGSTLGGLCTALVRGAVVPFERTEGSRAEGVEITYSLAYPVGPGLT